MPSIDLSILNQRQTPAFYADTLANRPAAGFVGRIFVSTDTFAFFRDNGTGWDLIGGPGTGTVTGSGANGQVSFWNGASSITGSNNLFFDAVNGHLGIGTITPGTALEIDHDQNTIIQLQQTVATNDNRITFINSGVGLWRIGSFYNAGANDFGLFDIAAAAQPVTVKRTTGQVLIGTSTVGSGKLVVASATSDNGIQIVGAAAPSLRIDSAESGPTKRIGIGLATAVNNFIQNSQNLDMCIFNGSTSAAGNMLFGIYDTSLANIQEAARISSARNFLIGTITDTGQKLQVSGTAYISGNLGLGVTPSAWNSVFKVLESGDTNNQTAIAFQNNSNVIYLTTNSYFDTSWKYKFSDNAGQYLIDGNEHRWYNAPSGTAGNAISFTQAMTLAATGNLLIGTTTDAGEKLQVAGTARIQNTIRVNASSTVSVSTSATIISSAANTWGGIAIVWGVDGSGNAFSDLIYYSLGSFLVLSSQSVSGAPSARIYSTPGTGNLLLTMALGTYTVRYQAFLTA